ncbi:MAG: CvpA family protein [Planctomycetes bacterium]|nr:CvpA family protein [Planctomycetota bacterium]
MIATLILCVMVGVLTYYQVFKQGLFSTTIMAIWTLVAAMLAFNYYEILHEQLMKLGLVGYPSESAALLGVFIISLLLLRLASDQLIKGNMKFTMLIDRIGSAGMSLIASLIMTGMIAIGFQMLPLPAKILGYDKYPDISSTNVDQNLSDINNKLGAEKSLFPYCDSLVYSVVKLASANSFAGSEPYSRFHPDLFQELYMNRLLLNKESGSRIEAASNALKFQSARLVEGTVVDAQQTRNININSGDVLIEVVVQILPGSTKKDSGANDMDSKIRFVMSNFRLIGYDLTEGQTGFVRYPLGIFNSAQNIVDLTSFDQIQIPARMLDDITLLFAWPGDLKANPPKFIEFKRWARAPLPTLSQSPSSNGS